MQFNEPMVDSVRVPMRDAPDLDVAFTHDPRVWHAADVDGLWRARLAESVAPHSAQQTPAWLDHRLRAEPGQPFLLAMVHDAGVLVGVAPLMVETRDLDFAVGDVNFHASHLRCAVLLGGAPLLPRDGRAHDALLLAVADELGDCDAIDMDLLPREDFAYQHVESSRKVHERFLVYEPAVQGAGPVQRIELPASFDAYLAKFGSKTRSTLKRRVRMMHDQGGFRLVRYDTPGSGGAFLDAAAQVARHTWQRRRGDRLEEGTSWPRRLADLADHGLLRSYVLFSEGRPCAFVLGFQVDGAFHYVKPGYDPRIEKLSPGTVLLYSMLEDMYGWNTPRTVCFCTGDAQYKRFFANAHVDTADVLLLRRGLHNRVLRYCHAGLRGSVARVKEWLGRRPADAA